MINSPIAKHLIFLWLMHSLISPGNFFKKYLKLFPESKGQNIVAKTTNLNMKHLLKY